MTRDAMTFEDRWYALPSDLRNSFGGAIECSCDALPGDKTQTCGDCPRDYIAGAWDARRAHLTKQGVKHRLE